MKTNKFAILFIISLYQILPYNISAQEIKGDTIFTSYGQEHNLYFPASITSSEYNNQDAYNNFTKKIETSQVSIRAKIKNAQPAILKITEGTRNHWFVIAYKDGLKATELVHDWEDLKVLEQYVANKTVNKTGKDSTSGAANNNKSTSNKTAARTSPTEEKKEDYNTILRKAFDLFENKKYLESRELYEKAVELRPDEKIARSKISEIDSILKEAAKILAAEEEGRLKEKEYKEKITAADKAFYERNFEEAKELYSLALSTKQNDAYAKRREAECQQNIQKAIEAKKARENDDAYQKSVAAGKVALQAKRYEDARAAYSLALDTKPGDPFARNQIGIIDNLFREEAAKQEIQRRKQERETAYNEALANGNDAFNNGNLPAALSEYIKAKAIKDEPYLNDQIKKINQSIAEAKQKSVNEQVERERERLKVEIYKKWIEKADQALLLKKYAEAKSFYKQALNYKQEQYASDKIAEIEKIDAQLAAENESKRKYNLALSKAKSAMASNDLNKAKSYFEEAHTFRPDEPYAKAQLEMVYKQLENIAKQKELEDRYDTCIQRGGIAMLNKEYKKAQDYYTEARQLKPQESLPGKMLKQLDDEMLKVAETEKRLEIIRQRRQIVTIREEANKAILDKRWNDALKKYQEILTLNPLPEDKEFASQKIIAIEVEIGKVDSLKVSKTPVTVQPNPKQEKDQKKRNAVFETQRQKQERIRQDTIAAQLKRLEESKKQAGASSPVKSQPNYDNNEALVNAFWQNEAIPYDHIELLKKYPDINFDETPSGQSYDPTDRKNRSLNFEISKRILSDTSSLNLFDSINYIKAICKSISFNGNNAFIKILIRNNSLTDFLTGRIQLKVIKKNKTSFELNQRFISDFPVVLPQREFPIVYVSDASSAIESTDILIMEINDRSRKTKLEIAIPGALYNMRKTAKL